ncbi:hypothetical protein OIU85_010348 [Salix viminalis]|uniref:Uncharacterized protein n=1 Tax=Salix viminalis TaxID=40686 RepID=A0A9Q0SHM8_SALVM|nr:hypothetical protein OIU85_010348 [Salix viminalis]
MPYEEFIQEDFMGIWEAMTIPMGINPPTGEPWLPPAFKLPGDIGRSVSSMARTLDQIILPLTQVILRS